MFTALLIALLVLYLATLEDYARELPQVPGLEVNVATVPSTIDGREQKVVMAHPEALRRDCPAPLLVGLHTWSADYRQQLAALGPLAVERNWRLLLPDFRGPNLARNPRPAEAGGSLLAQHDVLDAVEYASHTGAVDETRRYLLGGSGGGHMALLVAAKAPGLWAAVSAWCPVTDLRDWHAQANAYAPHIEAVCGGPPGASPEVDFEYQRRSPRTFMTNLANTRVRISHGDHDPTIPVAQTWRSFEALRGLSHRVEFQSWCGGHDLDHAAGVAWLAEQQREPAPPRTQQLVTDEAVWYFWVHLAPTRPLVLARAEAELMPGEGDPGAVVRVRLTAGAVRLRLPDLGLSQVRTVLADGRPLPGAATPVAEGVLTLPAAPETGCEYLVQAC